MCVNNANKPGQKAKGYNNSEQRLKKNMPDENAEDSPLGDNRRRCKKRHKHKIGFLKS